jgi:cytochrome P450
VAVRELPSASLVDTVQINQAIIVPNAVQGLFRRRPAAVGIATRLDLDGRAVRLMEGLRSRYGPGPVWIRVMTDRALLCLDVADVARTLDGSPHPFASDPAAKRKGMTHFQPDALTISRGELWANRRAFTESVLETPAEAHSLAGDILDVVVEEVDALFEAVGDGPLDQVAWEAMFRRLVRRVVLGDAAAGDEQISELLAQLMSGANGLPSDPAPEYPEYMERLTAYVEAAEAGSLTSLFAAAPHDVDTRVEGQVTHWLFALQDTLAINALRALALLATHPEQRAVVDIELEGEEAPYLAACLQEAMRLFPTTPLLSRETLVDVAWHGATVPAGTQVLIVNAFHHRDRAAFDYADRFAPQEWTEGDAAGERAFNHFSQGPQGCPGRNLALLIGTAVLAQVLRGWPALEATDGAGGLDPSRPLPYSLNPYALRFGPGTAAAAAGDAAA